MLFDWICILRQWSVAQTVEFNLKLQLEYGVQCRRTSWLVLIWQYKKNIWHFCRSYCCCRKPEIVIVFLVAYIVLNLIYIFCCCCCCSFHLFLLDVFEKNIIRMNAINIYIINSTGWHSMHVQWCFTDHVFVRCAASVWVWKIQMIFYNQNKCATCDIYYLLFH